MPNLIVLNPQAGDSITLTGVASVYNQPSAFQPIGVTVYSTGSIPANAGNALAGKALTISDFANARNNGTFLVTSSTATSITTNNAFGVVVSAAATASFETQSTPAQYASKISNVWSNQSGDNVTVNVSSGDTLVAVVIGLKQIVDFDQLHGEAPYYPQFGNSAGTSGDYPNGGFQLGQLAGLNDFNANPTISDFGGGLPVDIDATKLATGTTLTVTYVNPSSPTNYFTTSEVVTLSGTKEPFLNGLAVTVASTPSATTFTATIGAISYTLTSSDGADVVPGQQTTTTYNGAITGGADDALAGVNITVAGFTNSGNNGLHTCVGSTATTITLLNSGGVEETVTTASASLSITEGASTFKATAATVGSAGNSVTVAIDDSTTGAPTATADAITLHTMGSTVAAYAAAHPSISITGTYTGVINFSFTGAGTDMFTTASAAHLAGGISAATAAVTSYVQADDSGEATPAGNVWTLAENSNIIDSDYTVAYPFNGPLADGSVNPSWWNGQLTYTSKGAYAYGSALTTSLTPSDAYQSSKWSIDGYYPSIYIYVAPVTKAGSYKVNLNSMYQPGVNVPADWSNGGQPIFDGGVNFQVFSFSGSSGATDGTPSISTTETILNPATAPATITTTAADGDALISVGLIKSGNTFAAGTTGGTPLSLTLSAVAPLQYGAPQFAPQNYGGAVYTGTITGGANNFFVGYTFTVAGFPAVAGGNNNGTFTCTASTATTLTLSNGEAVAATHAGTAAYRQPMIQIGNGKLVGSEAHYMVEYALVPAGTYNPGFQNPLGYPMLVASVAIASN